MGTDPRPQLAEPVGELDVPLVDLLAELVPQPLGERREAPPVETASEIGSRR